MSDAKPVYVYHEGSWRLYRWSRDLLDLTSLGDVIPGLEVEDAEDCAVTHLFTNDRSAADIIAVERPAPNVWEQLEALANG